MIGLPLALLYSNAWEWVVHKYALHGLGNDRESFWNFPRHDHHKHARREAMGDHRYGGEASDRARAAKKAAASDDRACREAPVAAEDDRE